MNLKIVSINGVKMELKAITDLARIKASTMVGLVVIFGMIISLKGSVPSLNLFTGFLVGFLVSASTNTINDILDRDIDFFQKPNRPIPRKGISVKEATILFSLETLIGLLLALYLNLYSFLLSASVAILSVLYSWRLKNILLLKNIITSFGISSALLVGVFATSQNGVSIEIILFFLLIFIVVIAFEMQKDIADVEWDGKNKKNTVPVKFGTRKAAFVVISLYLLSTILYHGVLLISGNQIELFFWVTEVIILLMFIPLLKLITQHNDVEYVHKTRKLTMGGLLVITVSLIVNFLN